MLTQKKTGGLVMKSIDRIPAKVGRPRRRPGSNPLAINITRLFEYEREGYNSRVQAVCRLCKKNSKLSIAFTPRTLTAIISGDRHPRWSTLVLMIEAYNQINKTTERPEDLYVDRSRWNEK